MNEIVGPQLADFSYLVEGLNRGVELRDWTKIARRWSGRGRMRTLVLIMSLLFSEHNAASQIVGTLMYFIGLVLHLVAKGHLVRNEQLCRSGPYGWVRHPFYIANLVIDLSICITAGAFWIALSYIVIFPLAYLPRILAEEQSLEARFGSIYLGYAQSVPRLLPIVQLPSLWQWVKGVSSQNLRNENEISRQLRLCAYLPLLHASIVLKQEIRDPSADRCVPLIVLCALSVVLWSVGEIYHRLKEDG